MVKVLITGAGVDKTTGIDFPLANTLITDIAKFIENEGSEFNEILKTSIPNLRFNLQRFINTEINSLTSKDDHQLKDIVVAIQSAIDKIDDDTDIHKKRGTVIVKLFEKLMLIQTSSQIDQDTFLLIQEAFGEDYTESDFIIDINKMSLSDTFKSILKTTLQESLTAESNPISTAISSKMLDIEQLLVHKFLGFYNHHLPDVKSYIYISWVLWGFLVWKQQQVINNHKNKALPFYSKLPQDINAVTLNYTTFLKEALPSGHTTYFHGGLDEYVRMDTRQLLKIEEIDNLDLVTFFSDNIKPNINVEGSEFSAHRHIIPSLVPPLKLKPVLSQKYIDLWSKSKQVIHDAKKVVVIGYSFNDADEHFNDIVRNGNSASYDIIAPDALEPHFIERIEKVFSMSSNQLTTLKVQGKDAKSNSRIRLIKSYADEIDVSLLFND